MRINPRRNLQNRNDVSFERKRTIEEQNNAERALVMGVIIEVGKTLLSHRVMGNYLPRN
jgi:hypothetical protein